MQMKAHLKTGKTGEDLAVQYLRDKNYDIVRRNFRIREGEIDIIARKGDELIFVEVKTARSGLFGAPETWVGIDKQKKIIRTAQLYLQEFESVEPACRFDVIAVHLRPKSCQIDHFQDAFWME